MQVFQEQNDSTLKLAGGLNVNTAEAVCKVLLDHLQQHAHINVDLSRIEDCDAAGAQLLIAFEKSAEFSGKSFSILAISEALVRDCANIGIRFAPSTTPDNAQSEPTGQEAKKLRKLAKTKSAKKVMEASHA